MRRVIDLPKYIHRFIDRHGKERFYVRMLGRPKVPLRGVPFSTEFMDAYKAALGSHGPVSEKSLEWLCRQYYKSAYFLHELSADTQRKKRSVLDEVCAVVWKGRKIGVSPYKAFTQSDISNLRDMKCG
jgi:hypothetical protein